MLTQTKLGRMRADKSSQRKPRSSQVKSSQIKSSQAKSSQVEQASSKPGQVKPNQANSTQLDSLQLDTVTQCISHSTKVKVDINATPCLFSKMRSLQMSRPAEAFQQTHFNRSRFPSVSTGFQANEINRAAFNTLPVNSKLPP